MRAAVLLALVAVASCKSGKPAPTTDDAAAAPENANLAAVRLLRSVLEDRYSHRDRQAVDWDAAIEKHRAALEGASGPAQFAQVAATMLAAAKDTHIIVTAEGVEKPFPTYVPPLAFNIDISIIASRVVGLRNLDPCVAVGKLDDKTGYLLLASFVRGKCPRFAASFAVAWQEVGTLPRMIIDLRGNSGGDETLGRIVAAKFVTGDTIYAHTELGPPRDNTQRFPRKLVGVASAQRYAGATRVLIGGGNLSSAEAFILMMKQADGCKLVGARTFGSSGNPKEVLLGNGVSVHLPSWRTFTVNGEPIEGRGIDPDIAVAWPPSPTTDPVLDAAIASF